MDPSIILLLTVSESRLEGSSEFPSDKVSPIKWTSHPSQYVCLLVLGCSVSCSSQKPPPTRSIVVRGRYSNALLLGYSTLLTYRSFCLACEHRDYHLTLNTTVLLEQ